MNRRTFLPSNVRARRGCPPCTKLRAADAKPQKKIKVAVVALGRGMGHVGAHC
jgi:hypothetical protein